MQKIKTLAPGVLLAAAIAAAAHLLGLIIPDAVLGKTLIALLLGMALSPLAGRFPAFNAGVSWTSKRILRAGIILGIAQLHAGAPRGRAPSSWRLRPRQLRRAICKEF